MLNTFVAALRSRPWIWLALASAMWVAACGGGEDRSKAKLRLVHGSPAYAALDLVVADKLLQSAVPYGADAGYAQVDPADTRAEIRSAGAAAALYSGSPSLSKDKQYSLVAYGRQGALSAVLLDDNQSQPDSGKARLRVLNGAVEAGAVDVYLTTEDTALADSEPLQAKAAVGTANGFVDVNAATWRLRVTAAGDANDLRLDLSGLVLASRQVTTLVITPTDGGVLVQALLLIQGGAVDVLANTRARVRAVAGVTDSGAVAATVSGVSLLGGVGSPAVGPYLLVPAGAADAHLTVNGGDVAVPATDLLAGSDYTLLVWGPVAGAAAAWLTDDNRPPSVSGRSRLRLVHGVAGLDGPIALTVGYGPVADSVLPGTASASADVSASLSATLVVTSPGLFAPLFTATDQVLLPDAIYSLLIVGPEGSPTGILFQDR
ncbi:MAG: DUF4397 domain-containing protein [Rubrivivax sp.]|nr:DUF4397 domain-containing protein [Rubrivivax sp.]MDH5339855.1 DUF4397 domain-containing protein [Rubrivivax sp.]